MKKMFNLIGLGGKAALPTLFALTAACVLSASSAKAAVTIATWTFSTAWTAASSVNIAAATTAQVSSANLAATVSGTGSTVARTFQGASFQMDFNPAAGVLGTPMSFVLQFTTSANLSSFVITYDAQVSATTASTVNTWAYSTDSGATYTAMSGQPSGNTTTSQVLYTVSQNTAVANGNTIYFRDTVSGASANGTDAYFDNITVTAVPEPTNYALAGFGLMFVGIGAGRFYLARRRSAKAS
jgi:hypothetical protein